MAVFDDMMTDAFKRIASEAKNLCQQTGKKTLSSREIQTAVRLILPGAFPRAYWTQQHPSLTKAVFVCSGSTFIVYWFQLKRR
jgi:histone H2B